MTHPFLFGAGLLTLGFFLLFVGGSLFFHFIYEPYRVKVTDMGLDDVLSVIASMIKTEIDLLERSVFKTRGSLDNANFENYYYLACNEVLKGISKDFWHRILLYYTKEAVVQLVSSSVSGYLSEKVMR